METLQRADRSHSIAANAKIRFYRAQIDNQLDYIESLKIIPQDTNIITYWEENKYRHSELHQLSEITFAVPASQASVERNFSINAINIVIDSRQIV